MGISKVRYLRFTAFIFSFCIFAAGLLAQNAATVSGEIFDPVGQAISGVKVELLRDAAVVARGTSDGEGKFTLQAPAAGRFSVRATASGFATQTSSPIFVASGKRGEVDVTLQIGALAQQIVVSATGTAVPESRVGASVSVVSRDELQAEHRLNVADGLRSLPGLQIVQTGQRGATTSLFVRGGNSDFNKVLIDGIPANDIGGIYQLADLSGSGVQQVEILRGPNSVLYGSDAMASVINVTTPHGVMRTPEFNYAVDGGNFGSFLNEVSVAGAIRQFDYFSEYSHYQTQNTVPNSAFHAGAYAGSFGWSPNAKTEVRFTLRKVADGGGNPNAYNFYGIADDSFQRTRYTYWGATLQNQSSRRWHNLLRFASGQQDLFFDNPSPTGTPFDPFGFGANYLGNVVTIHGANGYTVTGQAILDYAGTYPSIYDAQTTRRSFYAQSDYEVLGNLTVTGGFRYEHEDGVTTFAPRQTRDNYSTFLQSTGNLGHRLFATAGVGFENNEVFGFKATPRVSAAYYLRRPAENGFFGDAKLKFNYGNGITEPSITNQQSSLFAFLSNISGGPAIIQQHGITPIGPERSQSVDFGVEQSLWNHRARLGVTLFHEKFYDLIEYLSPNALTALGVAGDVTTALGFSGATVNADSFKARGVEFQTDAVIGHGFRVRGVYTYLDAYVTKSFTNDALSPSFNPAFPNIPIGAFAPLLGARPFNRAPHSGSVLLDYEHRKYGASLSGSFVGRRDGSTFLYDGTFGPNLLLPNRNLMGGYQLLDLNGRYSFNQHIQGYFSVSNLLSQHYQEALGFPSLPLNFRVGMKFTFGGETGSWR